MKNTEKKRKQIILFSSINLCQPVSSNCIACVNACHYTKVRVVWDWNWIHIRAKSGGSWRIGLENPHQHQCTDHQSFFGQQIRWCTCCVIEITRIHDTISLCEQSIAMKWNKWNDSRKNSTWTTTFHTYICFCSAAPAILCSALLCNTSLCSCSCWVFIEFSIFIFASYDCC